ERGGHQLPCQLHVGLALDRDTQGLEGGIRVVGRDRVDVTPAHVETARSLQHPLRGERMVLPEARRPGEQAAWGVEAAELWVAAVCGAAVAVVAGRRRATLATAVTAHVGRGAHVAVVAGKRVVVMLAARPRVAAVVGAGVAVVAGERSAALAAA